MTWTTCTIYKEFLCGALDQFRFGNLKGLLSKCIGKWSGTPMINSKMETLRNAFRTLWKSGLGRPCSIPVGKPQGIPFKICRKLVWIVYGRLPCGNLKEFRFEFIRT